MAPVEIHVLVFEDSPTDVVFLREALARDPLNTFTLRVVERLSDGLPLLEAAGSDVVLLDLGLPDSQGLATFERVHQAAPDRPIVVFSGNSDEQDAIAAVRAGAQDYLVKSQSGFDMAGRAIRHAIERHNLVKSLQASELRLSTIFRTSPLPIVISRLDDGRYTEANAAFEKLTGYTAADIIGHTAAELNIWEVPERRRKMIEAVRANGFAHNFEFQLRHRSGEHRDLLMSAELIDLDGEPQVLTVGQDITERKRMEEALQDANAKLTRAQHLAHIGSWTDYLPTLQLEWSEEMYRILGFPLNQPLNLTEATCVFPPDEKARFHQAMDAAINGTAPYNMDYRIIRSDGEVRYIHDEGEVVRDAQGQAIWMHGTTQDITERKQAELAIRQWADAFENCAHGIALGDPHTNRILACNSAFARLHHCAVEDIVGTLILSVYAPDDHARVQASIAEADRVGQVQYEARMIRRDGSTFPVQMDVVSVRDTAGNILYRVATMQDVTERQQAEAARRESEALFAKVFQASPVGINIFRLADGRSVQVNDAFLDIVGYTRAEVLNHTAADLNLFVDTAARASWLQALRNGQPLRNLDAKLRRKSGEIRDALASLDVIDLNGEPMTLVITTDITDRKQTEAALLASEERYRGIFNGVHDAIFVEALDGSILDVNQPACAMYGYSRDEFIGKHVHDIIPAPENLVTLPQIEDESAGQIVETVNVRANGEHFPVELRGGPFEFGDQKMFLAVVHDITERKQRERELTAVAEVSAALRSAPTSANMLAAVVDRVMALLTGSAASITFDRPAEDVEEVVVARGEWASLTGLRVPRTHSVTGQVALTATM
ncbi:MAG: PAS domain S-box protein [Anaerolineae bacterium]